MPVYLLSDDIDFPPPQLARRDGLLAVGGDLSEERLLTAYRNGIFPWYQEGEPLLWWSPDPRLVLFPRELHVPKRLKRLIRRGDFEITLDSAFRAVVEECAKIRTDQGQGTWITSDMVQAYCSLYRAGFAHSVEAWCDGRLVGGVYGVSLGRAFFGESMFSRMGDASKVALVRLTQYLEAQDFDLIDCQIKTEHLLRFGAREIPRTTFLAALEQTLSRPTRRGHWSLSEN